MKPASNASVGSSDDANTQMWAATRQRLTDLHSMVGKSSKSGGRRKSIQGEGGKRVRGTSRRTLNAIQPPDNMGGEPGLDVESPQSLLARAALRTDVAVLDQLGIWWQTALNSMRITAAALKAAEAAFGKHGQGAEGGDPAAPPADAAARAEAAGRLLASPLSPTRSLAGAAADAKDGCASEVATGDAVAQEEDVAARGLDKHEYTMILKKIIKVLTFDYDETEAILAAEADWRHDCKGLSHLQQEAFFDAFFELADLWTVGISSEEYTAFLKKLFHLIAEGEPPSAFFWRPDDAIHFGGFHHQKRGSDKVSQQIEANRETERQAAAAAAAAEAQSAAAGCATATDGGAFVQMGLADALDGVSASFSKAKPRPSDSASASPRSLRAASANGLRHLGADPASVEEIAAEWGRRVSKKKGHGSRKGSKGLEVSADGANDDSPGVPRSRRRAGVRVTDLEDEGSASNPERNGSASTASDSVSSRHGTGRRIKASSSSASVAAAKAATEQADSRHGDAEARRRARAQGSELAEKGLLPAGTLQRAPGLYGTCSGDKCGSSRASEIWRHTGAPKLAGEFEYAHDPGGMHTDGWLVSRGDGPGLKFSTGGGLFGKSESLFLPGDGALDESRPSPPSSSAEQQRWGASSGKGGAFDLFSNPYTSAPASTACSPRSKYKLNRPLPPLSPASPRARTPFTEGRGAGAAGLGLGSPIELSEALPEFPPAVSRARTPLPSPRHAVSPLKEKHQPDVSPLSAVQQPLSPLKPPQMLKTPKLKGLKAAKPSQHLHGWKLSLKSPRNAAQMHFSDEDEDGNAPWYRPDGIDKLGPAPL